MFSSSYTVSQLYHTIAVLNWTERVRLSPQLSLEWCPPLGFKTTHIRRFNIIDSHLSYGGTMLSSKDLDLSHMPNISLAS